MILSCLLKLGGIMDPIEDMRDLCTGLSRRNPLRFFN